MGKLSSIPFFVLSMHIIHRRLPNIKLLTHFVVRLENSLNSMPPNMVTLPSLMDKCLMKSLASQKLSNAQPNGVLSGYVTLIILWPSFFFDSFLRGCAVTFHWSWGLFWWGLWSCSWCGFCHIVDSDMIVVAYYIITTTYHKSLKHKQHNNTPTQQHNNTTTQ